MNNFQVDEKYIQSFKESSIETGYIMMINLLDLGDPSISVISTCDVVTFHSITAIHEWCLKVFEGISMIGTDGIPLFLNMFPTLTIDSQPVVEKDAIIAGQAIVF